MSLLRNAPIDQPIPVLVDEAGGIIAGHGRILAAHRLGIEDVPVMVAAGWSDSKKRAYMLADNKLMIGFSESEIDELLKADGGGLTDPEEAPEPPAEPVSRLGDVWLLVPHRIVCGDCTVSAVVDEALRGVKPHLMVTDAREGVMAPPDHHLPVPLNPGQLATAADTHLVPALIADAGEPAAWRYIEFFTANIRNSNTRRAYARACSEFFAWCEVRGLTLTTIRPFNVSEYIETLQKAHSAPGVKQQLAAVRMLFDWLITGQVVPVNPASAVRGPKHVVKTGKTPVLDAADWRKLLDTIPTDTVRDLRDRALIATLIYSFARITAALKMKVEDLRPQGAGWRLRLHEKGGKHHAMPCHHALAEALHAYIAAAGIAEDRKGWLFRTSRGHDATVLSEQPMNQSDAWRMIRRRAVAAGIHAPIGNHTFRATGITAYLANGGALEHAQEMAAHESPRTTKLYDRTKERLTQDEVERIRL